MILSWAFVYLAAAVAGHAWWVRRPNRGNSVVRFLAVGGAAGLALTAHLIAGHGLAMPTFAVLAVYAFACELYIFLFTLVGTSIGVRLLLSFRNGTLAPEQIEALLSSAGMVACRLERLRTVGFLDADGRLAPKGRRLVRAFRVLRSFFGVHGCPAPSRSRFVFPVVGLKKMR